MSRQTLPLPQEHSAPFDLETCVQEAARLNPRTLEAFTLPFPQAPDRWLSHDQCWPRSIPVTAEGEVEGGRSWRLGATIDRRLTRSLLAPDSSKAGGHCDDPASACFLEGARRVDGDPDDANFCAELRPQEKGRRDRELAGLHTAIPGEDDLRHLRRRVGAEAIEAALTVFVGLCRDFGRIKGERLAPAGQLEPSSARDKSGAYFGQDCPQCPVDEASRQELCRQGQAGAKRLESRGPCPEVVQTVRHATAKQGQPREPTVALLEIDYLPPDSAKPTGHQQLAERLSLPPDQLPPLRLQWSHLTQGPQGELWGRWPKVPADLKARVG